MEKMLVLSALSVKHLSANPFLPKKYLQVIIIACRSLLIKDKFSWLVEIGEKVKLVSTFKEVLLFTVHELTQMQKNSNS